MFLPIGNTIDRIHQEPYPPIYLLEFLEEARALLVIVEAKRVLRTLSFGLQLL